MNVHPFLLAGWCVLTTNALNLLPVGKLDGGRMAQTAFGNLPLAFTSFATYLGTSILLPGTRELDGMMIDALGVQGLRWGYSVEICQRPGASSC